jgi:hypothetical protein
MGWSSTKNGKLLDLAQGKFDVLLTADQNLPFQQNLENRNLAVVVLAGSDNQLGTLQALVPEVLATLETIEPGRWVQIKARVPE